MKQFLGRLYLSREQTLYIAYQWSLLLRIEGRVKKKIWVIFDDVLYCSVWFSNIWKAMPFPLILFINVIFFFFNMT